MRWEWGLSQIIKSRTGLPTTRSPSRILQKVFFHDHKGQEQACLLSFQIWTRNCQKNSHRRSLELFDHEESFLNLTSSLMDQNYGLTDSDSSYKSSKKWPLKMATSKPKVSPMLLDFALKCLERKSAERPRTKKWSKTHQTRIRELLVIYLQDFAKRGGWRIWRLKISNRHPQTQLCVWGCDVLVNVVPNNVVPTCLNDG
jgi:hypothetical protein